mmetsp:Transcript_20086/g.29794  ORF Transcript_20086/g.29794 Transcript_20086/m.29794 type:complete len:116 (+) Transcript_20086:894-1241(+)
MEALVEALKPEQSSSWGGGCDRAFAMPVERGEVVGVGFGGAFTDVVAGRGDVVVDQAAGKFKFAVVDSAVGVFEGDEVGLDAGGEAVAPDDWNMLGVCSCSEFAARTNELEWDRT